MRQGMSISEFTSEINRQAQSKRDFIAPAAKMSIEPNPSKGASPDGYTMKWRLSLGGDSAFPMRKLAHQQIAERIQVPWQYYERMAEDDSELLSRDVNHWLHKSDDVRMVRTLDGQARAVLGQTYRPMDNFDLVKAITPTIVKGQESLGLRIESMNLTETRLYMKIFSTRITGNVKVGDTIQAGVLIQNSEVGFSNISVTPMSLRLVCLNGATHDDLAMKRRHVGRRDNAPDGVEEYLSDRSKYLDDAAFWSKITDAVSAAFDDLRFKTRIEKMQAALDDRIPPKAKIEGVQEIVQKTYNLTQSEGDQFLRNLIEGADLSRYGVAQAITAIANSDEVSYDRAGDLERLGGRVLELPQTEWKALVAA